MRLPFKSTLLLATLAAFASGAAWAADTYPDRAIRLVVPYAPGGATDTVARLLSQKLSEALGQSVVVENKPGANGLIGTEAAARAEPDGYTLLLNTAGAQTLTPVLYKTNYEPLASFEPITLIASIDFVAVVHPSVPANTMGELVNLAKTRPNSISMSVGSSMITLIGERFKSTIGAPNMISAAYKGTGPQLTAVLAHEVDMTFDPFNSMEMIKAGKLRPLAVLSPRRSPTLPDVPTMEEAGIPNMNFGSWAALLAPAGTPQPIVERLHKETVKILQQPDVQQQLANIDYGIIGSTPAELGETIRQDVERWKAIVKESGYKVDS